jgi:hypothetical protein
MSGSVRQLNFIVSLRGLPSARWASHLALVQLARLWTRAACLLLAIIDHDRSADPSELLTVGKNCEIDPTFVWRRVRLFEAKVTEAWAVACQMSSRGLKGAGDLSFASS